MEAKVKDYRNRFLNHVNKVERNEFSKMVYIFQECKQGEN
jgi:hypothetical protein